MNCEESKESPIEIYVVEELLSKTPKGNPWDCHWNCCAN